MSLITLQNVDFSVGGPLLLEKVNLTIETNERICIVGRNGAGKSTLMRLFDGQIKPDDGEVRSGGVSIAGLAQEVPSALTGDVFDVVAMGLGELGADLAHYHHLIHAPTAFGRNPTGSPHRIRLLRARATDRSFLPTDGRLRSVQ